MTDEAFGDKKMLSPSEVAREVGVDPKTVTRWARGGKIKSIKTPGGHRRYSIDDVQRMLNQSGADKLIS